MLILSLNQETKSQNDKILSHNYQIQSHNEMTNRTLAISTNRNWDKKSQLWDTKSWLWDKLKVEIISQLWDKNCSHVHVHISNHSMHVFKNQALVRRRAWHDFHK